MNEKAIEAIIETLKEDANLKFCETCREYNYCDARDVFCEKYIKNALKGEKHGKNTNDNYK